MREYPILFNGDMVRSILAGTKTQTRRPVKFKVGRDNRFDVPGERYVMNIRDPRAVQFCPYGQPSDHLWVRETWHSDRATHPIFAFYRADGDDGKLPWRPSIHMPRWACRLVLKITSVRVECVQEITEGGAIDEGALTLSDFTGYEVLAQLAKEQGKRPPLGPSPRERFLHLWDSLYAAKGAGWDANPWVWVVEFKRVTDAS
jgi:hypothetical protein